MFFGISDGYAANESKVGPGCSSPVSPPHSAIIALSWLVSGVNESMTQICTHTTYLYFTFSFRIELHLLTRMTGV